jgi:hypothetical protein
MKSLLISLLLLVSVYADDIIKGQTYYLYTLKDKLGYNGAVFSKKYTKAQWKELFSNEAQELKILLSKENKELKPFLYSEKFNKISPFLQTFVQHYAKDAEHSASCN